MIITQLTDTYQPLIYANYNEVVYVKSILITNITTNNQDVYVNLVKNENGNLGTPTPNNLVLPPHQMVSLEFYEFNVGYPITFRERNDAIFAKSSSNNAINTFIFELIRTK